MASICLPFYISLPFPLLLVIELICLWLQKQIFLPPSRRIEEKEDAQTDMERAFEDMYLAATDYRGDLSLALDPHPLPPTPATTEALDLSNNANPHDEEEEEKREAVGLSQGESGMANSMDSRAMPKPPKEVLADMTNSERKKLINTNKTPGN